MKLAVNALSARQGGGPTYIINFIRHFPPGNDECVILAGEYNAEIFRQAAGKDHPNLRIEVVPMPEKAVIRRSLWEMLVLPGYLKKNHIDVYYAPGGMMLTRVPRGVTSVTAVRNMWPWDIALSRRYHRPLKEKVKHWIYRRLFLWSYRRADKVVFISRYSMDCVARYYPSVRRKAALIPHGLDAFFISPSSASDVIRKWGLEPGKYYLYVSQYNFYKSQKEVIAEWEILRNEGFPYPLVLAGRIRDGQYGLECEALIREKNLEGPIRTIDRIPHEDLPPLLQNAHAILFASACECCPNILLEKMASGRPVFCDTIPPMPEFGGENLYYFDLYKPGDLARVILSAEKNPQEMEERAVKTRDYAAQTYRWSGTVQKTLNFFAGKNDNE